MRAPILVGLLLTVAVLGTPRKAAAEAGGELILVAVPLFVGCAAGAVVGTWAGAENVAARGTNNTWAAVGFPSGLVGASCGLLFAATGRGDDTFLVLSGVQLVIAAFAIGTSIWALAVPDPIEVGTETEIEETAWTAVPFIDVDREGTARAGLALSGRF